MSPRILVAVDSSPVAAAVRRALETAGYEVDVVPQGVLLAAASPGSHAVAIVHAGDTGAGLVKALNEVDAELKVVALFLDEEEARRAPDSLGADGVLVGPLTGAAIVGTVRLAERYAAADRRARELAFVAGRRADGAQELAFLKRVLLLEVRRSRRYGYPVSLALVAVDGFAARSAALGPADATALLAEVLAVVIGSLRDIDLAVPFGEDRLVVLLPHTPSAGALRVAQRLVGKLREHQARNPGGAPLTISAGVAGHDGQGTVSFGGLVKRAATALTRAVSEGGDRAEAADPPAKRDRVVMG